MAGTPITASWIVEILFLGSICCVGLGALAYRTGRLLVALWGAFRAHRRVKRLMAFAKDTGRK